MADEIAPTKLMLIAVDVQTGKINEPHDGHTPDPKPRVVGIVKAQDFDEFVAIHLGNGKAERVRRANEAKEPYSGGPGTHVAHVATIVHTHNSPGCTWVTINGWPFCY